MTQENERRPEGDRDQEYGLTTAELAGSPRTPDENREQEGRSAAAGEQQTPLFPQHDADDLRHRWDAVQASFVDEPRRAVEDADSLVAGAMKRLAETFAAERATLESQWDRGDDVSTEDLRIALQRYRSFFARLLSM